MIVNVEMETLVNINLMQESMKMQEIMKMQSDILIREMKVAKLELESWYTLFDLRGDAKTLCKVETFFG